MSVKDLRDLGVTLHLPLMVRASEDPECENERDRDPLPDVPAVYIVSPTDANIRRICKVNLILMLLFFVIFVTT